jgi:glycosyltransferase involved in cell wall biosynthesis
MLLLFGVASKGKGADLLFQALEQVPPNLLVYVVGQTGGVYLSSWGEVEGLRQRGWRDKIHLVSHYVSEEVMQDYYAACDAVVIPYRHGFAGTSTSLRRASEYGKAILGCDQHHIGERIQKYGLGLTFRTEDVGSLAATLREFAGKPDTWFEEIATRSRQLLADESWERVGQLYQEMFSDMWSRETHRNQPGSNRS